MDDAEVLMKPATTLDDVLREVKALREEVRKYQEAIEPGPMRINFGPIVRPLDARGTAEGKISFGLS